LIGRIYLRAKVESLDIFVFRAVSYVVSSLVGVGKLCVHGQGSVIKLQLWSNTADEVRFPAFVVASVEKDGVVEFTAGFKAGGERKLGLSGKEWNNEYDDD
jgi:hypothetical protein